MIVVFTPCFFCEDGVVFRSLSSKNESCISQGSEVIVLGNPSY